MHWTHDYRVKIIYFNIIFVCWWWWMYGDFSPHCHTHNKRFYTRSIVDTKWTTRFFTWDFLHIYWMSWKLSIVSIIQLVRRMRFRFNYSVSLRFFIGILMLQFWCYNFADTILLLHRVFLFVVKITNSLA